MKLPVIRLPIYLNILILIISLIIAGFFLLFGIAHIVEAFVGESNPSVPYSEQILGWVIVISLCLIGIIFLLVVVSSAKGIQEKINKKQSETT